MKWVKLFDNHNLEVQTKVLPTKGNLVYEYNPFRNYRIDKNMYEYKGQLYSLGDLWEQFQISLMCKIEITKVNNVSQYTITSSSNTKDAEHFGETVKEIYSSKRYLDIKNLEKALKKCKDIKDWHNVPETETDPYLREAGELCDFITDELSFSLDHPVHIIPQHSYDCSVNLIINDGLNTPRLINSRFSATGRNTYEIVDRKGNNDTNIYDQGEQFDIDTSLYKRVIKIPKIDFKGVSSGGNLKVGNYHFYFKLSDADGNETDFVGESGLVSVFIGFNDYFSVTTGQKNENSFKCVNFQISNIDSSYDYVTVYYSRSTAEGQDNSIVEYVKIDKKYPINNASNCNINITGYENCINISNTDINLNYNIVDSAYTSAVCQNMLFLGNVHRPDIPYVELSDLSLRFLPYLKEEQYTPDIDHNYSMSTSPDQSYIDPKFIYNKTGYWGNEIYRFGIVYIMRNGDLSPVFNVRGNKDVGTFNDGEYTQIPIIKDGSRNYISYNEETFIVNNNSTGLFENVKGVVSFAPNKDTSTIYSVDFRVDDATIQELKKLVKGYFFVRQTRIPTILAQGITIGIDKESRTPTIPTTDGFLHDLAGSLSKTHVTTEDINDVNYVSEGFLSRYSFKFEKKSSSLWGKIATITAIGIGVVALAAATVCSGGLAGVATGALAGFAANGVTAAGLTVVAQAAMTAVGTALTSSLVMGTAIAAGAAVAATTVAATIQEVRYGIASKTSKKKLDGRNTKAPAGYKIVESENSR